MFQMHLEEVNDDDLHSALTRFYDRPAYVIFYQSLLLHLTRVFPVCRCSFHTATLNGTKYWFLYQNNQFTSNLISACCEGKFNEDDYKILYLELESLHNIHSERKFMMVALEEFILATKKIINNYDDKLEMSLNFCTMFFMKEDVREKLREMKKLPPLPNENYSYSEPDPEADTQLIFDTWQYRSNGDLELTKEKLSRLPSSCIRYNGTPIAYEMLDTMGQLNHQFVIPEHRGKGLGTLIELAQARNVALNGFMVYKNVNDKNELVISQSNRSPYWIEGTHDDGTPFKLVYMNVNYPGEKFFLDPTAYGQSTPEEK